MADETSNPLPQGGRASGNREPGGFRIRLSDNEMRGTRAIQEAFRLRSPVAVLGFCVRTMAQLLEEGKLDALVQEMRNQAPARDGSRSGGRAGGEGRGSRQERGQRVDPFARPSRPQPAAAAAEAPTPETSPESEQQQETPVEQEQPTPEAVGIEAVDTGSTDLETTPDDTKTQEV